MSSSSRLLKSQHGTPLISRRLSPSHYRPLWNTNRRTQGPNHPAARTLQAGGGGREAAGSGTKVITSSWKSALSIFKRFVFSAHPIEHLAFIMPVLPGGGWSDLWRNRVFVSGLTAWFLAQFAKIFTKKYKKGVWDLMAFQDSGGMPSSHSAMSMAVTTAIALDSGLASPLFVVALCFTSIVMYDAAGVRKHAGYQAEVLNSLVEHAGLPDSHPFSARKLKEVLGHTPRQVLVGGVLGILVGMFMPMPTSA